jgi:hypothetical protein
MNPPIIGYIHIYQKKDWQLYYDMIMNSIKNSGLYNSTIEIRLCIVNDSNNILNDDRFNDTKIKIVDYGKSNLYERITMNHIRISSETEDVQYWYTHVKGISFFENNDNNMKDYVIDWINLLIYCNITEWKIASEKLLSYDIYGCEYSINPEPHYLGNFWWANSHYIRTLPNIIGENYNDSKFWILKRENVLFCNIFSSGFDQGDHFFYRYIKDGNY